LPCGLVNHAQPKRHRQIPAGQIGGDLHGGGAQDAGHRSSNRQGRRGRRGPGNRLSYRPGINYHGSVAGVDQLRVQHILRRDAGNARQQRRLTMAMQRLPRKPAGINLAVLGHEFLQVVVEIQMPRKRCIAQCRKPMRAFGALPRDWACGWSGCRAMQTASTLMRWMLPCAHMRPKRYI